MKTKSLFDYFLFGICVRYLQDAKASSPIHDSKTLLTNVEKFFECLDELDFQVTRRASRGLDKFYWKLLRTDKDATLSDEQAERLSTLMEDIRKTLEAEIKGFNVYVVTPKRIEVAKLLSDVPFLFAPGVFRKLPAVARYDIQEAGKCIAFERATAAAFHLMRATESVIRAFYTHHIETEEQLLMWGPMVNTLRRESKFSSSKEYLTLFNNLDNIRLSFRNPTQHPDKIYGIQEVQDLWGLCVDAITRMAKDLDEPGEA